MASYTSVDLHRWIGTRIEEATSGLADEKVEVIARADDPGPLAPLVTVASLAVRAHAGGQVIAVVTEGRVLGFRPFTASYATAGWRAVTPDDQPVAPPAAKKAPAKKAPVKKAPVKKAAAPKAPAKKAVTLKTPARKAPAKKAPVKKAPVEPAAAPRKVAAAGTRRRATRSKG